MLAYAANRPDPAGRQSSPNVMLFIIAAHIAAIAALMSYKMEAGRTRPEPPITVYFRHDPPPPPPERTRSKPTPQPQTTDVVSHPQPRTITPFSHPPVTDRGGTTTAAGGTDNGDDVLLPPLPPLPKPLPVHVGPQLLTPASQLRPPYPESKLINEEQADLRLQLTIGADGRVTAVDPIGRADPVFLEAARRYLVAHWRYRPATVDGRAVATTLVISLSFRLDD